MVFEGGNVSDERRKFLRVKKTFPFSFKRRSHNENYESETFDISLGGIGFLSPLPLKIKDVIYIKMKIPGFSDPMIIRGIAQWTKTLDNGDFFVGVEFFNVEDEERDIILKALREG